MQGSVILVISLFASLAALAEVPPTDQGPTVSSPLDQRPSDRTNCTDEKWIETDISHYAKVVRFNDEYPRIERKLAKEELAKGKEKNALECERLALKWEMEQAKRVDKEVGIIDRDVEICKGLISAAKAAGNSEGALYREGLLRQLQEIRSKMISQRDNSAVYRLIKSFPPSLTRAAGQACKAVLPLSRGG